MTDVAATDRRALLAELLRERIATTAADEPHPFTTAVNPELARILRGMGLDKRYVRGEGCWLVDEHGERYLDFTAAYGALPFGHSPEEIWHTVTEVGRTGEPIFVQPSILDAAGTLAAELVRVAPGGLERVTFANSGAEAIEVALKLARSATGRLGVLSTENAFHGKTLGALSATGRDQYQREFGAPAPGFTRVPFGDLDALRERFAAEPDRYAAFLVEPIQGEGGIHAAPPGYLAAAKELCERHGVLLIFDEVQTGLGRTGRLFACEHDGVAPDVLVLAKALGGGVVPAAAVLCRAGVATEGFALRHSSTFAGNALACRVGLRVVRLLTERDQALVRRVAENGVHLERSLRGLATRHPDVITAVRGRGYLLGLELTDSAHSVGGQGLLGSMAAQETLSMLLCSYLLNVEHIRLAPTLFGARVLRVEPPLVATKAECDRFTEGLDRALTLAEAGDLAGLVGNLVGGVPERSATVTQVRPRGAAVTPEPGERRFAFVAHPVRSEGFLDFDPALGAFDEAALGELMGRFADSSSVLNPAAMLIGCGRVVSAAGTSAYGELIGIPYTARQLLDLRTQRAVEVVRDAVALGRDRGADVVGLGAYTSIVTGNAAYLGDVGVPLTTGNGFTVTAGVEGTRRGAAAAGVALGTTTVAVVGATGSIGSASARLLAREVGRLILIGNPRHPEAARARLHSTAVGVVDDLVRAPAASGDFAVAALAAAAHGDPAAVVDELERAGMLILSCDPASLAAAHVVLAATSTPEPVITAEVLRPGAVVCDLAQPPNVSDDVLVERPDVRLFDGGIVELPGCRPFGVNVGLPDGLTFACMAETMLLALDGDSAPASTGAHLRTDHLARLHASAGKHGFDLAPLATWRGIPATEEHDVEHTLAR